MAIKQLNEHQIQTWTLEQKDKWWLENAWRGDMPQLTWRSAITGMCLGGLLSLTNLYIGAKTGWTLGVGITSVILAFALFKLMARFGLAKEFTILENNCMQSIATAAGYMTAPLISSIPAYMMVTGRTVPMFAIMLWIVSLAALGVLIAFPLKKRFINDEQLPFPEGRACGIVLDALHSGGEAEGLRKASALTISAACSGFFKLLQFRPAVSKLGLPFYIPDFLDEALYRALEKLGLSWVPKLAGVPLSELTVRLESDLVMIAVGGLVGIKVATSLFVGAVINYLVIVPLMIARGDIVGRLNDAGTVAFGFRTITEWSLWWGVAMMTTSSLVSFFSKPEVIILGFRSLLKRGPHARDVLEHIELPMWIFAIGIPLVGSVVVILAHIFFEVRIWHGVIAIPLIFLFTLIAVNSTGLTAITPVGALGKLTQLTFSFIAPGDIKTNLATASITAEVASNASNLLMDIKPGYMLGAKPRQQAIGHMLGALAGTVVAVPLFSALFLSQGLTQLVTGEFPMPAATVWKSVAEILTKGWANIAVSARWAMVAGAVGGIVLELLRMVTRGRFWLSGVGIGLAAVIPFWNCLSIFLGALFFWFWHLVAKGSKKGVWRGLVENQEAICGGVIAGGAIVGIALLAMNVAGLL